MIPPQKKQKLYCYVDETGQDTKGDLFIVVVVVAGDDVHEVRSRLEAAGHHSKKGLRKWFRSNHQRRLAYVQEILYSSFCNASVCYAVYRSATEDYLHLTINAIAAAFEVHTKDPFDATVLIDGLDRSSQWIVAQGLRKRGINGVKQVRGIDDKKEALIRLADAMAGFIRDVLEGTPDFQFFSASWFAGVG